MTSAMAKKTSKTAGQASRPARLTPLYHQIYIVLRQALTEGDANPSEPLPSEPALAARYGVSRVTVRKTLEQLEREGLVCRVRGVGTFPVAASSPAERTNISGLLENLISVEATTTARELGWKMVRPAGEVARVLGPDRCLRIVRVRSYQGQPVSLTTLHVPAHHAARIDRATAGSDPIIRLLERAGVIAERAEQTISAIAASSLAARELGVAQGSPLIIMRRLMVDAAHAPVLHQESLYAPDRFEYRMTLNRTAVGPAARWTPVG